MLDPEIYLLACQLVRQYGQDAVLEVEAQASALLSDGGPEDRKRWRRILAAVQELLRTAPPMSTERH